MSSKQEIFGGAITVTLPNDLIDASNFRQIPDTQEVFLDDSSGISVIIEVLQCVDPTDQQEAARFHFDSLAHDNSAVRSTVLETSVLPVQQSEISSSTLLSGTQLVPKFNATTSDEVQIFLALYRIPSKKVDLLMTMNVPTEAATGAVSQARLTDAESTFITAAQSLYIVNFGLFA